MTQEKPRNLTRQLHVGNQPPIVHNLCTWCNKCMAEAGTVQLESNSSIQTVALLW